MFRKKDAFKSSTDDIPARFVKKAGVTKDYDYENYPVRPPVHMQKTRFVNSSTIPSSEIAESYITSKQQRQNVSAPNSAKGARKKFPPFFLRKKKNQAENRIYENIEDEEDVTEIACYEDLVAEQQALNPVILGQLDDTQLNRIEVESFEKNYNARLEYILNNYRKPPPYPGTKNEPSSTPTTSTENKSKQKSTDVQNKVDTPLINQLLIDKQIHDTASMNNFWQVSPSHHADKSKQAMEKVDKANDKLVDSTQNRVKNSKSTELSSILNAGELYEKRRQYYIETLSNFDEPYHQNDVNKKLPAELQSDSVSEIFPERDYDDIPVSRNQALSASVPDLSQRQNNVQERNCYYQRRSHMEPGEMEALIAHYRKTSLDSLEPYHENTSASESVSLYSEGSHSYVPPSPYLNAEIPEWLQVYAKASPDLDKYLKWEMFRYPELDCWQTMLKRLYKKEIEQVVLWFEEFRKELQQEINVRTSMLMLNKYENK